eukprot:Amastigsp_a685394_8.p3 type:complete len:118 gc:universal Amastigsp_a685394_8:231-584(+)
MLAERYHSRRGRAKQSCVHHLLVCNLRGSDQDAISVVVPCAADRLPGHMRPARPRRDPLFLGGMRRQQLYRHGQLHERVRDRRLRRRHRSSRRGAMRRRQHDLDRLVHERVSCRTVR